jgi:hypothetical protein
MGAIYVPRRLARYRWHDENLTRVRSVTRTREGMYVWQRIAMDRNVPSSCRLYASRRAIAGVVGVAKALLRAFSPTARRIRSR